MEKTTKVAQKNTVLHSSKTAGADAKQEKPSDKKPVKASKDAPPRVVEPLVRSKDNLFDKSQAHRGLTAKNNSQMSRVIEYGVSASAAEREDAEKRAKLEARIVSLKKTIAYVDEANGQLALLPTLSTEEAKNKLLAKVTKRMTALYEHPNLPLGASTPMRKMRNELISAREGFIADGVLAAFNEGEEAATKLKATLQSAEETLAILIHGNDVYMDKLYERAREIIERTGSESRRLESLRDKPMVISRIPIVPLTDPPLNPDQLNRLGVKTENLGGYPLIHNQLVIGINKTALAQKGRKVEKPMEAVERYLKILSKQMGRNITTVSNQGVPGQGGVWYWLADERTINAFRKAGRDQLKIRSWGFGWGESTFGS
jgi:hypothetical protein